MRKLYKKIVIMFILSACMIINVHADNLNVIKTDIIEAKLSDIDVQEIYNYDIYWDSMNFTYTVVEDYVFNNETNVYDKITNDSWNSESNSVEILNNGDFPILVTLNYVSDIDGIDGSFDLNSFKLIKNDNKKVYLNLTGSLPNTYSEYTKIGNILMEVQ